MKNKLIKDNKYISLIYYVVSILAIVLTAVLVNSFFNIGSYIGDDASEYRRVMNSNFFEYVFFYKANRFRPFTNIFVYLRFLICGTNMLAVKIYSIVSFSLMGIIFLIFSNKILNNKIISLISTFLILYSRFSWYNVTQMIGTMENICIILLMLIVYFMYEYLNGNKKCIYFALGAYFLILFSHERYFVLIIPIVISLLLNFNKSYKQNLIFSGSFLAIFLAYVIIKVGILQIPFAVDTGGKDGIDFNFLDLIVNFFISIGNLLQLPISKDYLVGITFDMMNPLLKSISIITVVFSSILVLLVICKLVFDIIKKNNKNYNFYLFTIFSIVVLVCSTSISARIEMRFLYSSYILLMFIFGLLISQTYKVKDFSFNKIVLIASASFLTTTLILNKSMTDNIYPFYYIASDNKIANSYREEIIEKYQDELETKHLIINTLPDNNKKVDNFLYQFNLKNGYSVISVPFESRAWIDTMNTIDFDNNLIFDIDVNYNIKRVMLEDYVRNYQETWLEGTSNTFICYSEFGEINFDYYVPKDLLKLSYSFYINDVLIKSESNLEEKLYNISYYDKNLSGKLFTFTVNSNGTYNPGDFGSEDIRKLQIYVTSFNSDKYLNVKDLLINNSKEGIGTLLILEDDFDSTVVQNWIDKEKLSSYCSTNLTTDFSSMTFTDFQIYKFNKKGLIKLDKKDFGTSLSNIWTEGLNNEFILYSSDDLINLSFYIPDNFIDISYKIYINGKLIKEYYVDVRNNLFKFKYNSNDLIDSLYSLRIESDKTYNPADFGIQDIRKLQMFIVNLNP